MEVETIKTILPMLTRNKQESANFFFTYGEFQLGIHMHTHRLKATSSFLFYSISPVAVVVVVLCDMTT